jgi:transaldolase
MTDTLGALSQAGVSIWLDDLSRERLVSGSLAKLAIEELQDIGIDFGDVMQGLEDDAVTRFDRAWQQLGDQLATALRDRPALQTH